MYVYVYEYVYVYVNVYVYAYVYEYVYEYVYGTCKDLFNRGFGCVTHEFIRKRPILQVMSHFDHQYQKFCLWRQTVGSKTCVCARVCVRVCVWLMDSALG